jgi:thiamine-monophosphate kinase
VAIPPAASRRLRGLRLNPLPLALHGGDDYELLFTVPRRHVKRLSRAPKFRELTPIGEITRSQQILLVSEDGTAKTLRPGGWDPFRIK